MTYAQPALNPRQAHDNDNRVMPQIALLGSIPLAHGIVLHSLEYTTRDIEGMTDSQLGAYAGLLSQREQNCGTAAH